MAGGESFATTTDLEIRWHALTESEKKRAQVLLEDASDKIRTDYPTAITTVSEGTLRRIVCAMVKRAMTVQTDYEGVKQMSQTTGSFADSYTFANPDGDLYFTSSEKQSLTVGDNRVFTVSLGG
ncbi:Gp19/Gp15/Gp42 family protein [Alloscardovia sp. HMSC034E08]|uniref:Gp19/Gp15/Gp42 family protein n=1 Tax=Alloscardovia sp. HMSC034E08 TaxID=1739413 RepID=UPI0008BACD5D|nr:Gp19/Gp15/Gp42 family protein [Alloscardovia sp. HMSC034E08]OFR01170.1 hypothetical protein HMPREF2909_00135 [Alloscardovia sp. HMSC034E08]